MSDLKTAHKIRNVEPKFEGDFFNNAMLKSATYVSLYSSISKKAKFVMSFPLLKLIGHEIALNNWSLDSNSVFWSACCMAFFGSFRLGEILPKSDRREPDTLSWNQIKFTNKRSTVVNIRFPKVILNNTGDFGDLFEIKKSNYCPFSALKSLADKRSTSIANNLPVF